MVAKTKTKNKKKSIVVAFACDSEDILVLDVLKLNTKLRHLKELKSCVLDALKNEQTVITVPEESCPIYLEYSEIKTAEVLLPHKVDAILTVYTPNDI